MPHALFCFAKIRTDIKEITYFKVFNFLIQEMELQVELKHMLVLMNFAKELTQALGSTIAKVHPVFKEQEPAYQEKPVIFA